LKSPKAAKPTKLYVQFFESFQGKKSSTQSEFRAKSYARFMEDPPKYVLAVAKLKWIRIGGWNFFVDWFCIDGSGWKKQN